MKKKQLVPASTSSVMARVAKEAHEDVLHLLDVLEICERGLGVKTAKEFVANVQPARRPKPPKLPPAPDGDSR